MQENIRPMITVLSVVIAVLFLPPLAGGADFQSSWPENFERPWAGPEYWANRLQDWRISGGRLECVEERPAKPMRTLHLLTHRMAVRDGDISMSVRTGAIEGVSALTPGAAAGFLIGPGVELEYRAASLVHHSPGPGGGLFAGIDATGRLFIRDFGTKDMDLLAAHQGAGMPDEVELRLSIQPAGARYIIFFSGHDPTTEEQLGQVTLEGVVMLKLMGNLALVSHSGEAEPGGRFWFRDWHITGSKIDEHDSALCGPILCTQYTLHNAILKMTAQMMPLGERDNREVALEILESGRWKRVATSDIITPGYTAPFRVEGWGAGEDTPYRVVYNLLQADGQSRAYTWSGTVRSEPLDKPEIVVAAFTGNHNVQQFWFHEGTWQLSDVTKRGVEVGYYPWSKEGVWFPHHDLTGNVAKQQPDLLFFSGDQVYEVASPTTPDFEKPYLDYLYKWYLWCWAFRDLCSSLPAVTIPDDHDIYQGNIWGAGGKKAETFDDGGYTMPPDWVNMVQRTQTSHLPDPFDPTPVEQGIDVYYTSMNYGGISFAIIEDRKFKSSPTVMLPEAKVVNGFCRNPDFDPVAQADVPGAVLLGERQLRFLGDWASDLRQGVWMKVLLSQTLFAACATIPADKVNDDQFVPKMRRLYSDEYPSNDIPVIDMDTNAWPQTGRNRALYEIRRGFAFHIAGDQHLGTTIQYGIDEWNDASWALCVPSVANFWARRWYPAKLDGARGENMPRYAGEYRDGFGNLITVHAAANPVVSDMVPATLHDNSPGYGIAKFNREDRTITVACWPRYVDPSNRWSRPYPGWPITIKQTDNYGGRADLYLPTIEVTGMNDPVVQVVDEEDGEVVYTLRIRGTSFRPRIFKRGTYTVKVGEQGTDMMKILTGVKPVPAEKGEKVGVSF